MTDRKRVNGPELSVQPIFEKPIANLLNEEGKRSDGRTPEQIRPIFLKTGLINQANGSAYIELNKTKVVCAVYGPRQTKRPTFTGLAKLNCEVKFATFSCAKRRGHQRDPQERNLSNLLHQAVAPSIRLELLPKSTIDIFCTILENDGTDSCIAAGITAASVALADAGIEMVDLVAGGSAACIDKQIFMDVMSAEESHKVASLLVSYMPSLNEVTHMLQIGEIESSLTVLAIEQCIDACSKIHGVMSAALLESLENKKKP